MNIRKRYNKIKETKFLALDISTSKRKTGKSLTSSIEVLFAKGLFNEILISSYFFATLVPPSPYNQFLGIIPTPQLILVVLLQLLLQQISLF